MNKDDQRVRETVQAELRRRRGALDRGEEVNPEHAGRPGCRISRSSPGTANGHAMRPTGGERRELPIRQWLLPSPASSPSGTSSE